MAAGQDQLTRIEYEREIKSLQNDHELLVRVAMDLYDVKINCAVNCKQPGNGKNIAFGAGSGGVTAIIIFAIDYFLLKIRGG